MELDQDRLYSQNLSYSGNLYNVSKEKRWIYSRKLWLIRTAYIKFVVYSLFDAVFYDFFKQLWLQQICLFIKNCPQLGKLFLVHGQVTIIFVLSVCLLVCAVFLSRL